MKELIMPKPNPKQLRFMQAKAKHVAYGGARGGGKSWIVRWMAVIFALAFPGIKVIIVRKTLKELKNNHINPLKKILKVGTPDALATYNTTEKEFTFGNGSVISFGYCACEADLDQYQGAEFDIIFLEEAGQLLEEWIKKIVLCIREPNGLPKRIYYTLNPGGPSHAYFKRLFVDRRFEEDEDPDAYVFIQALVTDNEPLMRNSPEYVSELKHLPPKLREAWLNGSWDIFEGQFFEDFRTEPDIAAAREAGCEDDAEKLRADRRWVHVIDPFPLDEGEARSWTIFRSYDYGYNKPFSCGWWAVDYDGVMYRILELYGCTDTPNEGVKWTVDEQFAEIARIEREHPWLKGKNITGVADPAIFAQNGGPSMAETAMKYGVYFKPGDNKREPGWMQCHYRFQFDKKGFPRVYIFSTCKHFIRTIPLMMYDKHHLEDLDTTLEDHIPDEYRYAATSRPIEPMRPVEAKKVFYDPLDQFNRRR